MGAIDLNRLCSRRTYASCLHIQCPKDPSIGSMRPARTADHSPLRIRHMPLIATAFSVLTAGAVFRHQFRFKYDDSYITFRYAQRLADHAQYNFNDGELTNSASSFLFTVLLSFFDILPFISVPFGADLISAFSLLLIISFLIWLSASSLSNIASTFLLIGAAASLMTPTFIYWLGSGMETTLFVAFLITASGLAVLQVTEPSSRTGLLSLLLAGLVLSRFDGVIFSTSILASLALGHLVKSRSPAIKDLLLQCLKPGIATAFAFSFLLGFNYFVSGQFIPDSARQKQLMVYYDRPLSDSFSALYTYLSESIFSSVALSIGFILLSACIGGALRTQRKIGVALTVLIAQLLLIIGYLSTVPHADYNRYYVPASAPIVVGIAFLARITTSNRADRGSCFGRRILVGIVGSLLLGWGALRSVDELRSIRAASSGYMDVQIAREEIGLWMEEHLEPQSTVWSGSLASIAFHNPSSNFIDGSGLTTREVLDAASAGQDPRSVLFGHGRYHVEMSYGSFESSFPRDWDAIPTWWPTAEPLTSCDAREAFEAERVAVVVSASGTPLIVLSELTWHSCA